MAIHYENQVPQYVGAVLTTREENGYHDSDFYAVCWDAAAEKCVKVEYASTRFAGGGWAEIDATPEVRRAAYRWHRRMRLESALRLATEKAAEPIVGREVRILRGKRKGFVGLVRHRCANPFRTYYRNGYNRPESLSNQRVKLQAADGAVCWTDCPNVEVLNPEPVRPMALRCYAQSRTGYETAFAVPGMAVL